MNENERRQIVDDYLRRLARELDDVPADSRRELLEDVRGHIEEAWASAPEHNRETLLAILARLGTPATLAREERERLGIEDVPRGPDLLAIAAVVLTALFFIWPLGILLAWISPRWRIGDKAIATLIPILGLVLLFATTFAVRTSDVNGPQPAVVTVEQGGQNEASPPETSPSPVQEQEAGLAVLGVALALYGIVGAPITAAIYLAVRIRPRRSRRAVLVPLAVAVFLMVGLSLATILPLLAYRSAPTVRAVQTTTPVTVQPNNQP